MSDQQLQQKEGQQGEQQRSAMRLRACCPQQEVCMCACMCTCVRMPVLEGGLGTEAVTAVLRIQGDGGRRAPAWKPRWTGASTPHRDGAGDGRERERNRVCVRVLVKEKGA